MPKSKQAIAEDPARRLPAPFDDVSFQWDIMSQRGVPDMYIWLQYIGAPDRLVECGAIEVAMAGKSKVKSRPRLDSAGHYYQRELQVNRNSMTNYLKITRWITDPKLAESLPGAPRGPRFKRLDWLDAHPDQVHVHVVRKQYANRSRWVETITAGTVDNLLTVGFSESFFTPKFTPSSPSHYVYGQAPVSTYWRVTRLMRGYFEVRMEAPEGLAGDADETPAKPSIMRLAWSNPNIPAE